MARESRRTSAPAPGAVASFVERASAVLDQIDYYRLLSISSASDQSQIRAAYYKLASNLHPDVHGVDVDPVFRAKLTSVFSRVVEAYKVLSDAKQRIRYDRDLAKGHLRMGMGTEVAESVPVMAEGALRFYNMAQSCKRLGDWSSVAMNLRFAQQIDPENQVIKAELQKAESELRR